MMKTMFCIVNDKIIYFINPHKSLYLKKVPLSQDEKSQRQQIPPLTSNLQNISHNVAKVVLTLIGVRLLIETRLKQDCWLSTGKPQQRRFSTPAHTTRGRH